MKLDDKTRAALQACLDHSRGLLESARAVQLSGHPNIAYHLATLALEELGRRQLLGVRAIATSVEESPPWMGKHTQDHIKKLFWCFFGQVSLSKQWTKQLLMGMDGLAKHIHAKRVTGLYVDVDDAGLSIPSASIPTEEAEKLIELAAEQLQVAESVTFLDKMPQEDVELQAWFLNAAADNAETRRMILSSDSMAKLANLGDARKWMLWLKQLVEEADAKAAAIMQTELARSQALPNVGTKEKWKMRVVIYTGSHSLRPKEFAEWNAGIDMIKLSTNQKKDRLFVDICLLDNIPAEAIYLFCWGIARHFVTALNIGSLGLWWWRMPEQVAKYYETLEDLENNTRLEIDRSPPLKASWGPNRVLTKADLVRVTHCFSALPGPHEQRKQEPYGYYLAGLNFLSINDVHWQCEGIAFGNFFHSLKGIMKQCGYWDADKSFLPVLTKYFEEAFPRVNNKDHMLSLFKVYDAQQPINHQRVKLDDAVAMKFICDHFFLREILPAAIRKKVALEDEESRANMETGNAKDD